MSNVNPPSVLEVYRVGETKFLTRVHTEMAPSVGDYINIAGITYQVKARSFAVDYNDKIFERQMRCNIEVEKQTPRGKKCTSS